VRDVFVEGADVASGISSRLLQLDHIGTEVSEDLATKEALFMGEIKHPIRAQQRSFRFFIHLCSPLVILQ